MKKLLIAVSVFALAVFACVNAACAQSGQEKTKDDLVRIYVGVKTGLSADYAHLVARHIGKYLDPREAPTVIVESKPGAGGIVLGNYFYSQVPPDGKAAAVLMLTGAIVGGDPNIKFDIAKMPILGFLPDNRVLIAHANSGLRSLEDLKTLAHEGAKRPLVIGASSAVGQTAIITSTFFEALGAVPKVIPSYQGSSEAFLALRRGEVNLFLPRPGEFDRLPKEERVEGGGPVSALCQLGVLDEESRVVKGEGVTLPTCQSLVLAYKPGVADTLPYRMFAASLTLASISSPLMLPPGTPEREVARWSEALKQLHRDPRFLSEAKRLEYGTEFISAGQARTVVDAAVRQMQEVKMREFLNGLK